MDIVRRLKQEFSGTALEDVADQVRVYVKERHEAADEIERLREENKKLQLNNKPQEHLYYDDGFGGYPSVYNRR